MRVGEIEVTPVADGSFRASPAYFGPEATAENHEDLFSRHGKAWLPIGCFLLRAAGRLVLVDAGMGPAMRDDGGARLLVGGQLLTGLRAAGVSPAEVDHVVCTHLHTDHCGWLFGLDGQPVFPGADIWFGAADWTHFVTDPGALMFDHIRHGFQAADASRLRPVGSDTAVAPGVDLLMTPGHTPGHLSVVVSSGRERALLLGDAIVCPAQLDEPAWSSIGDVDPALARRTRERLFRELESPGTVGAGAHFPELRFGRLLTGGGRTWVS